MKLKKIHRALAAATKFDDATRRIYIERTSAMGKTDDFLDAMTRALANQRRALDIASPLGKKDTIP